jgi:hypothetical protein
MSLPITALENTEENEREAALAELWHQDVPQIQALRKQAASKDEELSLYMLHVSSSGRTRHAAKLLAGSFIRKRSVSILESSFVLLKKAIHIWAHENAIFITKVEAQDTSGHVHKVFKQLVEKWKEETATVSSFTQLVLNQNYQNIIGLGPDVVPLLLRELRHNPDHWFWALASITRENPVRDEDAGDVELMAKAWLQWGKTKGYG